MKALLFNGPGDLELIDRPVPAAGRGQVLVEVLATGVCGSDVHGYTGASGRRQPGVVMGHEVAGAVASGGAGVDPGLVGRAVVVFPIRSCGVCEQCRLGRIRLCSDRSYLGIHRDGGFAEYVVADVDALVPIPAGVDPAVGSLAEPMAVALHAVRSAPGLDDASVLVAGCGPIGCLIGWVAKRHGATRVIGTDIAPHRRAIAQRLGFDDVLDPGDGLPSRISASPVDVAFDAVGIQPTFDQALNAIAVRGTMVAVGGWKTVELDLGRIVGSEIGVTGSFNFSPAEFAEATGLLGSTGIAEIVDCRVDLEDSVDLFERLASGQQHCMKTVISPKGKDLS